MNMYESSAKVPTGTAVACALASRPVQISKGHCALRSPVAMFVGGRTVGHDAHVFVPRTNCGGDWQLSPSDVQLRRDDEKWRVSWGDTSIYIEDGLINRLQRMYRKKITMTDDIPWMNI